MAIQGADMSNTPTQQPVGRKIAAEYIELLAHRAGIEVVTPELALFAEILNRAERTARIEAQLRLEEMQELTAKSGLAHRKAVHEAVAEAVAAEREACAEIAADEDHIVDVPGYYAQLGDAKATAHNIEKAIRARRTL